MLAHIALVTLGYAQSGQTGVLPQAWDLVATYPGMLLATAGTGLLVMVVVTSVRAARRRLRYESWHLLHLYAYLGVGLALPHQIWTGTDFVSSPVARAYWWSLYAVALGAVLVYRLGVPAYRTLRHRLVVSRVVEEAPGRRLGAPHRAGAGPAARPGRPVLRLAVPRRARLEPRPPVLAVGPAAPRRCCASP